MVEMDARREIPGRNLEFYRPVTEHLCSYFKDDRVVFQLTDGAGKEFEEMRGLLDGRLEYAYYTTGPMQHVRNDEFGVRFPARTLSDALSIYDRKMRGMPVMLNEADALVVFENVVSKSGTAVKGSLHRALEMAYNRGNDSLRVYTCGLISESPITQFASQRKVAPKRADYVLGKENPLLWREMERRELSTYLSDYVPSILDMVPNVQHDVHDTIERMSLLLASVR